MLETSHHFSSSRAETMPGTNATLLIVRKDVEKEEFRYCHQLITTFCDTAASYE